MRLPEFTYHPHPIATGSIIEAAIVCACCNKARGYVYTGPVYAIEEYDQCICPWCIADGSAHLQLDASFTDEAGIGGYGEWDEVSESTIMEVAYRTPGFSGWQQERWWTHCGDAGQFLGRAGRKELEEFGPMAIAAIRASFDIVDDIEWERFFDELDKDGSPTAYLFRCIHCAKFGGYQDCD